jgi:hypothetical protein
MSVAATASAVSGWCVLSEFYVLRVEGQKSAAPPTASAGGEREAESPVPEGGWTTSFVGENFGVGNYVGCAWRLAFLLDKIMRCMDIVGKARIVWKVFHY